MFRLYNPIVLPLDINISPNSNGLPGISQLRHIVGASMTVGLVLAVLALIISAIVWATGRELVQPASGWPRQARRTRRPRRRGGLRRVGDAGELLLERRPVRRLRCGDGCLRCPGDPHRLQRRR